MKKYCIRDWSGNYPFEKNKHQAAVKLGGGPMQLFDSWNDAEDYLTDALGDDYDDLRGEFEIATVDPK